MTNEFHSSFWMSKIHKRNKSLSKTQRPKPPECGGDPPDPLGIPGRSDNPQVSWPKWILAGLPTGLESTGEFFRCEKLIFSAGMNQSREGKGCLEDVWKII